MNDSTLYFEAVRQSVEFGGAVRGSCSPLRYSNRYTVSRDVFTNGYGIDWFKEVYVAWSLNGKEIRDVYAGTLTIVCKEKGREHEGDWHLHYGIKIDGTLEIWAC